MASEIHEIYAFGPQLNTFMSAGILLKYFRPGRHFPCATSAKNPRSMYARVPQAMAQFVLKIEKLSHIMGPTPILEINGARLRSPSPIMALGIT